MEQINNFDEYCLALKSGGETGGRARLIHFFRSWIIAVQNLDAGQDAEKLNYVGLTEILNLPVPEPCDEVGRIARAAFESMRYISRNFREKILRENVMMPTYRAKEIGSAGLNWLSKRSGRTIREKLSSTNSLLAVQRRMSFDTGENRLYLAFVRQMEEYIEQKSRTHAGVVSEIERDFQETALKILRSEEAEEIGRYENLPPNNTLLSDRFYRQILRGWTDLQNVSALIAEDSRKLGARLCTVFFWQLLVAANNYCHFSQQPVEYDYAEFELRPLRGNSVSGYSANGIFTFRKFDEKIELDLDGSEYEIFFEDTTAIMRRGYGELKRIEITVENFDELVGQAADFIFSEVEQLANFDDPEISSGREIFLDIFSTRPRYLKADGTGDKFKARVIRQEFTGGGRRYDLSVENSSAVLISENAQLYSIASCINGTDGSREKFQSLFRMIHGQLSRSERKVERLSIPVPDIYNEFQLSAIRRAVRIYYSRLRTMPRSVAVLFEEMSRDAHEKFRDGDFALVVDYIRGAASLTLVQAKFDARIEKALPQTRGIIWERHPTYSETCVPDGYENFEDKLNDLLLKSGLAVSKETLDEILDVFGAKDLPAEAGHLALEFEDARWINLTQSLLKILPQTQFSVAEMTSEYLKRMAGITGGGKVHFYVISTQLKFLGGGAVIKTGGWIPIQGMNFYAELQERADEYEKNTGKKLPPLWSDQLPELAIKRLYGVFELISASAANKVTPQFGIAQKIPVAQRFTLPKGQKEYRFGLILGESKNISYEAVVRHRAFPLAENVECVLELSYTYGRDISYELIFKPVNSSAFREAKVDWEPAAERQYKNLPAPVFPADTETWETLQHIKTRNRTDSDALDWIENVLAKNCIVDFDSVDYSTDDGNWFIFVKTEIDGGAAILRISKKLLGIENSETSVTGVYSFSFNEDIKNPRHQRYETVFSEMDWTPDRDYCFKYVSESLPRVKFYKDKILFNGTPEDTIGHRVTFETYPGNSVKGAQLIIEDEVRKYYIASRCERGGHLYNLGNLSVIYPLHKVYVNGRSTRTPGCPEHFRNFIEKLAEDLPQEFVRALKAKDLELCSNLLWIMCVMAADLDRKKFYSLLEIILEKRADMVYDDWGCTLGNYDTEEQRQLLEQILSSSRLSVPLKIFILNRAAWKSEGFMSNVPARFILWYFESAIDMVNERRLYDPRDVLRALEYILACFRLRERGKAFLNKYFSLNNKKIQSLYETLEEMIRENYKLPPSRLELDVHRNSEYAAVQISDFYYALLVYITGGEDEIRISGISEEEES